MKKVDAESTRVYRQEVRRIAQPVASLIALIFTALLSASSRQGPSVAPSSPSFGPQRTITCPAGAVDIRPGSSIQRIVNAHAGNTTFCLRAGVHFIAASITPRSGNTFVGEYGAILDGTGWTTSDLTQAAFRAHSEDINDVTIRNIVIRHMPQRGIHAYSSGICDVAVHICKFSTAGADRWTIENNEIAYNVEGINVPTDGIIRHNYIHHNVGPDPFGTNGRTRGGGFESFLAQRALFEHNEIGGIL